MRFEGRRGQGSIGRQCAALVLALLLAWPQAALAERTQLKPGWNMFTPQQDVEIGQQVAADAERKLPIVNDSRITNYLNNLGRRLAAKAPGEKYPYQFKLVNDKSINAFALPGGFIYIHRGVVEAADNEAQLAGVMGHEIGHVALRHGTNQATKASFAQGLLGILGGVMGSGSAAAIAAQLGAGFAANSILLKYSRDAERQSDIIGTQILYDTGFDPRAMAQFFEKLQAESRGGRPIEFFSSHPNPENREEGVNAEIAKLGGAPANYRSDSAEFREFKRLVSSLPAPPKGSTAGSGSGTPRRPTSHPPLPSEQFQGFQSRNLSLSFPDNWYAYGQSSRNTQELPVTLAPEGGIVQDASGNGALAYGMMITLYQPRTDSRVRITLESATDQLLQQLRQANPRMQLDNRTNRVRIGREPGLSIYFVNDSSLGGREYGWIVTVLRNEGLYSFISVAPESEYRNYEHTFQDMLDTVRFRRN
jgi:Zn-dependent protease with chaperone function